MKKPNPLEQRALFNTQDQDFYYEWFDDTNSAHTLCAPSRVLTFFPLPQYEFMKKHLADWIMNILNTTSVEEREKVLKEISAEI